MNKTSLSLYSVKQSLRVGIPKPELGNETKRPVLDTGERLLVGFKGEYLL